MQAAKSRPPAPGILSPPDHIASLNVGDCTTLHRGARPVHVRRLAASPALFHLHGLLSNDECDELIATAARTGMEEAETTAGVKSAARPGCKVGWLPTSEEQVASISSACAELLLKPDVQDEDGWGRGGGFEDMQVLSYETGGQFRLHHDATMQLPRMLTGTRRP